MREQVFFTKLVNLNGQPDTSENTWLIAAVRTQIILSHFSTPENLNELKILSQQLGLKENVVELQHCLCKLKDSVKDYYPKIYSRVFSDRTPDMKPIEIV